MARKPPPVLDPAQEAAALLRRLGFAMLLLVVPIMPFVARRGIVIAVPIAVGLLTLAALVDGNRRTPGDNMRRLMAAFALAPASALVLWCGLSLAWTPYLAQAADRYVGIVATLAVAFLGFFMLPDRVRAANLYLLPLGVAFGAGIALSFALFGSAQRPFSEDGQSLERGLVVLSLMMWPAAAWLHSRQRPWDALLLGVFAALAIVLAPSPMPVLAITFGALVFGFTVWRGRRGATIAGDVMGGLILAGPILPFLARPLSSVLGHQSQVGAGLDFWRRLILAEPERLITGHGFETLIRARLSGALPPYTPSTLLFEIWYELGIVGAASAACALFMASRHLTTSYEALLPGMMGALGTAFAFAVLGIGTAQLWWFTVLTVVVLAFVACERGQFHTARPKASILTGARRA